MSRAFAPLPSGAGIDIPKGGVVLSTSNEVYAPSTMACTQTGVGFGPLHIGVPDGGSYCSLERVMFLPDEDEGGDGFLFFGLTSGGAAEYVRRNSRDSEPTVDPPKNEARSTRRDVLALAGVTLAAAVVGPKRVAAQTDELVALHIAELNVAALSAPMTIRVLDIVDQVLPPTTEIMVDVEESRVGEISDPGKGVTLPASTSGKISIYLRDSRGRLDRLLAWASGVVGGDEEITYARELPDGKQATEFSEGTFIKLSEHPALVEPVKEAGASETILKIGNTPIPHNDDGGSSEVGSYGLFDGALVYEVGPNPPASAEWSLQTRIGRLAALSEKYLS